MPFSKGNIPIRPFKKGHVPVNKGVPMSEEQKKKLRAANLGRPLSEEHKHKLSEAGKGRTSPNKGKTFSPEWKLKMSLAKKGKPKTEEHKRKIGLANKGKKRSPEICKKYSEIQKGRDNSREKNGNWKGGISFEPYCPKFTKEFKERVRFFFNNTCQLCGHKWTQGERLLDVHHVNFDKQTCCNNEIPLFVPLCPSCHGKMQGNREYYRRYFTKLINEKYNGICYLPKNK